MHQHGSAQQGWAFDRCKSLAPLAISPLARHQTSWLPSPSWFVGKKSPCSVEGSTPYQYIFYLAQLSETRIAACALCSALATGIPSRRADGGNPTAEDPRCLAEEETLAKKPLGTRTVWYDGGYDLVTVFAVGYRADGSAQSSLMCLPVPSRSREGLHEGMWRGSWVGRFLSLPTLSGICLPQS